jgi:teichuronic acid biosynthesis glycosyltransferase TuaG
MDTSLPVVSIITPVFNAARFLPRLFESVKSQHGVAFEHILVNDCSTDNSLEILESYAGANPFVSIISMELNKGPVVARNLAIRSARGRYLAFLDADDYWLPNKLFVQTQFMEQSGAALSFSDYRCISEDGAYIGRRIQGPSSVGWSLHHMTRYLGCLTIMINRNRCPDFEFPDISPSIRAEDFLAWARVIAREGPALRCKHDLARYSVVRFSRSSGSIRAARSVWLLYRLVEGLSFFRASIYFGIYAVFTSIKRAWFKPRWNASQVDSALAGKYLLNANSDLSK